MLVRAALSRNHIAVASSTMGILLLAGLAAALFTGGPWPRAVAMLLQPIDVESATAEVDRLMRDERYAEAIPLIESLVFRNRGNPDLEVKLATAMIHNGRVAEARKLLQALNKREPLHADTWVALGICQQKEVEYSRALDSYRAALRLKPDSWEANYRMGLALKDTKLSREAAFHFHKCIQIDPNRLLGHYALGMALAQDHDHAGAAEAYAVAINGFPDDLRLRLIYAMSLLEIHRLQDADAQLRVAESIDPTHPAVINLRKRWTLSAKR